MQTPIPLPADPWRIELIIVRSSHTSIERRSISRDVDRGLLLRLRPGAYVERIAFEALSPEDRHIVRMRAVTATTPGGVLFSHASACVLHRVPVMRSRLRTVHVTVEDEDDRHRIGLTMHRFLVEEAEIVRFGDLHATGIGRTIVDVAGGLPFEEGVMAADGALCAGVPRGLLESAIELAGPRRASRRTGDVVAFAHPGAESAGESRTRVTGFRLGMEVPVLQHRLVLSDGSSAFVDSLFPSVNVGTEFDGVQKFLDPKMAPEGAGRAAVAEKWREDEVRALLDGLARFGWVQAGSMPLLRGLLARAGAFPARWQVTLADYAKAARGARPRRPPRDPQWRA